MRLLNSLLPLLAGALASVAYSQQLDISGIRMGMSLDQAKARIGPGFTYSLGRINNSKIEIQYGTNRNEVWVLEAISGRLAYVYHLVVFPPQARPNSQDTLDRLIQKYGPIPVRDGEWAWPFTSAGTPLTGEPRMVQSCADGWVKNNVTFDAPGSFTRQLAVPGQFPAGCGISVSATMNSDPATHVVEQFSIAMVDIPAQAAEVARFAATQKQQQIDMVNRSRQNKAPF